MAGGTQVGEIHVDLDADISKFRQGMKSAESEATSFSSRISEKLSKAFSFDTAVAASKKAAVSLAAVGTAIAGFVGFGTKVAADLETSRQGFITLLGSAEKADAVMTRIKREAARTPFELPGLTKATQLLSSVTKDGDKAINILLDVGEGLAAMGKGQEELDRIIVNLQQVGAIGHAAMIDIKQFAFAGLPIFDMLKEKTGLAGDALDDFISEGGVTFDLLVEMFDEANNAGGRFFGAFQNQTGTFNQLLANMKDQFGIFASDLVKNTGIFDLLKDAINRVIKFLNENQDAIKKAVVDALTWIKENGAVVAGVITGLLAPAFLKLAGSILTSLGALAPYVLVATGIALIIQKIVEAHGGWSKVMSDLQPTISSLRDTAENLLGKLKEIWKIVKDFLAPVFSFVARTVREYLIPALKELWEKHGQEIIKTLKVVGIVIGGVLLVAFAAIVAAIGVVVLAITAFIKYMTFLADQWKTGWEQTKQAFIDFKEALIAGAKAVADFFTATWGAIVTFFTETLPNAFNNLVATVTYVFTHIPELIGFATGYMLQLIFDFADQAHTKIANFLTAAWDAFVKFFTELPGKTVEFVKNTIDALQDMDRRARIAFANMMEAGKNAVVNGINAIISFFRNLPGNIANALSNLVSTIANKFNEAKDAGQNAVKTMLDNIVGWITDLPRRVSSAVDNFKNKISQIAQRFSFGFNVGFEHKAAGGPIEAGKLYRVGEQGEEWIVPQTNGFVINNDIVKQLKSGMGGGGSYNITNTFVIDNDSRMNIIAKLLEKKEIEAQFGFAK